MQEQAAHRKSRFFAPAQDTHRFVDIISAEEKGADGITARDILECLPLALRSYRESYTEVTADFYGSLEVI